MANKHKWFSIEGMRVLHDFSNGCLDAISLIGEKSSTFGQFIVFT